MGTNNRYRGDKSGDAYQSGTGTATPDFSDYDWGSNPGNPQGAGMGGGYGGLGDALGSLGTQLSGGTGTVGTGVGGLPDGLSAADAQRWVDENVSLEQPYYQRGSDPGPYDRYMESRSGLSMGDAWEQERKRLKGIASGAIEDPSVIAMRKQQALAGAQAYGSVPEMQSAAARSRLQGGARGAVELEAGQALRAQQLQSQQAAQQNLAQQLAQAQATEQKRLEEERRAALAAELTRNQAAYRDQVADQQMALQIAQIAGTASGLVPTPKP